MAYKYILCDLDKTLVTDDNVLSPEALKTINRCRDKGMKFVICTGRSTSFCMDHLERLGILGKKDEIVLASTGTAIVNGLLEELDVRYIEDDDLVKIIDYSASNDVYTSFSSLKENYIVSGQGREAEFTNKVFTGYRHVSREEMKKIAKDTGIVKTMTHFFSEGGWQRMEKELIPTLRNCDTSSTTPHMLELNRHLDVPDKGLSGFCSIMDCKEKDVLAIGDSLTDKELLIRSGFGACPANSIDEIKEIADYVSPYDNNHDAVVDILNRFILND